jgi:hypothetical protein
MSQKASAFRQKVAFPNSKGNWTNSAQLQLLIFKLLKVGFLSAANGEGNRLPSPTCLYPVLVQTLGQIQMVLASW